MILFEFSEHIFIENLKQIQSLVTRYEGAKKFVKITTECEENKKIIVGIELNNKRIISWPVYKLVQKQKKLKMRSIISFYIRWTNSVLTV